MSLLSASAAIAQLIADADTLHQVVTGPASGTGSTVTVGSSSVKTIAKVLSDVDTLIATSTTTITTARDTTLAARDATITARDSLNTTGKVFANTTAGLAGTTNGQAFAVLSTDLQSWIIYQNASGVATEVARSYTKAYMDSLIIRQGYRSWIYAMTDLSGKLAFGVTSLGKFILGAGGDIVARITANETNITNQQTSLVRSYRSNRYAWMVLDAAKTKIALAVDYTGTLFSKGRDVLAEVDAAKALATAAGTAVVKDGNQRGAAVAILDGNGKMPWYVNRYGRVLVWGRDLLSELDAAKTGSVPATVRENGSYLAYTVVDNSKKIQIKTQRKSDGTTFTLTTTGNNVNPVFTSDNKVLFVSDSSGSYVQSYTPVEGGSIFPTLPTKDLACWGDSLTAGAGSTGGQTYPVQLLALLNDGRQAYNGGIGGQTAAQIAARQGGALSALTVTGNQIPASGAVSVTARTVNLITNQGQQSFSGTLAGVSGILSRAGDDSYTFTRLTAGSAVSCPANTPFIPDVAVQYRGSTAILILGRNSFTSDPTPLINLLTLCVAYLTPYYKNFLIGLVLNGTTEGTGTTNYNNIIANNNAIKSTWPNNYVDTQSPPTNGEMTTLGFVPDATDTADIANGCIPTHMRNFGASDTLHLNNSGYALWALRIKTIIQAKGW